MNIVRALLGRWYRSRALRQLPPNLMAGDLCSVLGGDGAFAVAKVLVVEPGKVHVRVYKNTFTSRPERITTTELSLGTIHDPDGFGMGHLPLSAAGFGAWSPKRIQHEPVTDDELDGYRIWAESGGGVWGD